MTPGNVRKGPGELSPNQEAAAVLLASGHSAAATAKKVEVNEKTVRTWQAESDAFKTRVRDLRSSLTERTLGLLADAAADAVFTLRALLKSKSEYVRLKAADSILTHEVRHRESAEIKAQVDLLQQQVTAIEAAHKGSRLRR
jgi:hypothetical protein